MQKLRIRIVKERTNTDRSIIDKTQKIGRYFGKNIYSILGSDALPLIVTPAIFVIFAGLGWWFWYVALPRPSAILPAIAVLCLTTYCFYNLFWRYKKHETEQNAIRLSTERMRKHSSR